MDHLLSWDWASFIFYPSPLYKLLIFWISQLQTPPNTTQSGLIPPCLASWEQKSKSHCQMQLFGLNQQHCQRDIAHVLGETRSRRKAKQAHECPAGTGEAGHCRLTIPVSDKTLLHQNVSLPFQAGLGLVLKHYLSASSQSRNIDQPMLRLKRG